MLSLTDGEMYWQDPVKSQEVETAAYVVLTHLRRNDKASALPVLMWLMRQRSPYGGFYSTQVLERNHLQ